MILAVHDLIVAIQSAVSLEKLQSDLRSAMIDKLMGEEIDTIPVDMVSPGS